MAACAQPDKNKERAVSVDRAVLSCVPYRALAPTKPPPPAPAPYPCIHIHTSRLPGAESETKHVRWRTSYSPRFKQNCYTPLLSLVCVCVCVRARIMYNFLITLRTNKPLYDSAVQLCAWRNSSIQPHQSTCMNHNLTARSLANRDEYKQFPLRRRVCGSRGGVVMVVCHQASSLPVCVVDNDMVTGDSLMATFLAGCRHFPLLAAWENTVLLQ